MTSSFSLSIPIIHCKVDPPLCPIFHESLHPTWIMVWITMLRTTLGYRIQLFMEVKENSGERRRGRWLDCIGKKRDKSKQWERKWSSGEEERLSFSFLFSFLIIVWLIESNYLFVRAKMSFHCNQSLIYMQTSWKDLFVLKTEVRELFIKWIRM